jgi:hypothetical protein
MYDTFWGIVFGAFITAMVIGAYQDLNENSDRNIIRKAVHNCEKSLPRNEHCYIIAVPPSKD